MTNRPFDTRLLAWFERTVAEGGVTRAAATLNITQPTLSKGLRQLEDQVGGALLIRHASGVEPTEMGQRLVRHAKMVAAQLSDALDEVRDLKDGRAGRVRIGAGPSWVRRFLPTVIARLVDERPDLRIELIGGFDEALLSLLSEGKLDFVVAERPLEEKDDLPIQFDAKDLALV